jgi:hypothetical protein
MLCLYATMPAVLGSSDQSLFRLVVEKFARQRQLAEEDRAALTQVQQACGIAAAAILHAVWGASSC